MRRHARRPPAPAGKVALATLLGLLLGLSPARAAQPRVALTYTEAADCPEEASFRARVAAHLGYEPFAADADRTLNLAITRSENGLVAALRLVSSAKRELGRRDMETASSDCLEFASAVAVAASLAINPLARLPAKKPDEQPTAPVPSTAPPSLARPLAPPSTPAPPPVAASADSLSFGLGAGVGLGDAPGTAARLSLEVGFGRGHPPSRILEAFVAYAPPRAVSFGEIGAGAAGIGGALCRTVSRASVCATARASAVTVAQTGWAFNESRWSWSTQLGGRIATGGELSGAFGWQLRLDVGAALARVRLLEHPGTNVLWTQPIFGCGVAGLVSWRIP